MPSVAFTAASSALSSFTAIAKESASTHMGPQIARFFANSIGNGAVSTLQLALVRNNVAIARFTGTSTVTARVAHTDGATTTSGYISEIVWSETGNSKFDLLGSRESPAGAGKADAGVGGGGDNGAVWMLGLTTLGAATTTLTVTWEVTRVI